MKNTKRNILISAILAIAMSVSLMVGATFALFTSESKTNISVTSGKVKFEATISEFAATSPTTINADGTTTEYVSVFVNGGTAKLEGNVITLENITPGDKVTFSLTVKNFSNVKTKYRTVVSEVGEDTALFDALEVKIGDLLVNASTAWTETDAVTNTDGVEIETYVCSIELPVAAGNEYQDLTCKLAITVEAIQANADTTDKPISYTTAGNYTYTLTGMTANGVDGVIYAGNGAAVTINGNGDMVAVGGIYDGGEYAMAVWAKGEGTKVVINGGNYTQKIEGKIGNKNQYDLIYASDGASIEINGGTFKVAAGDPKWTLNCRDNTKSVITVKGGSFYKFNPAEERANQVGEVVVPVGYTVVQNGDWYTVKEATPYVTDKSSISGDLSLDQIPTDSATNNKLPVEVKLGTVAAEDISYSEQSSGYTGKGVMLGNTKLNSYGVKPATSGEYKFIFKDGVITSAATGYESIDKLKDTSVYLLVPGNSDVLFENMTFNGVVSFNIQMYTSPWSYLNSITFKNCTFNGIVVGGCPANSATFDGCTFNNYTNTAYANNSNPIWWRSSTGYWGSGADESVHSLNEFTFVNNKVTSTRPVKIERISWNTTAKITILDNYFDISAQSGDTENKKMAVYIARNSEDGKFILVDDGNEISANVSALYTVYNYKEVSGIKILDRNGQKKTITAGVWKSETETFELKSVD